MIEAGRISVSIVSHGQMELTDRLLNDIEQYCVDLDLDLEVILTLNTDRDEPPNSANFSFPIMSRP